MVIALAALLGWMLNQMPKKTGRDLYVWYFFMVVIGLVLISAILQRLGLQR